MTTQLGKIKGREWNRQVVKVLVALTGSRYPDLVIGFLIGLIVLNGARRILQLKS